MPYQFRFFFIIIPSILLFSACNRPKVQDVETEDSIVFVDSIPADSVKINPCDTLVNNSKVWKTDFLLGGYFLIRGSLLADKERNAKSLVSIWNAHSSVQIRYIKAKSDTLYIEIPDSFKLTQSMGTTGAYHTLATMIYTLTEDKKYSCVNLDFFEGDHAAPGLYNRAMYAEYFGVCE